MTKMAAISIYDKNLYKASSQELGVYDLKIGMHHWGRKFYKAGINDDLWLTLTYFTAWLKLVTCEFEWENCYKVIKWENCKLYNGAIYMCMIIIFYFSRNRLANQGQTLCAALLERGNVNFIKRVSLT